MSDIQYNYPVEKLDELISMIYEQGMTPLLPPDLRAEVDLRYQEMLHYGEDIETVAPGACVYDGSYNFRKTRSSSSQSVHSWGVAIDFDASKNQLNTKAPAARLSQDIYKPFLDILEHHGFLSLGRRSNKDWMHVQMTLWG